MALRGTSNSRPSSSFNRISLVLEFTLLILIYTANISHGADIISVTRLPNQGDLFDVKSHGLICSANTCTKYNANQKHSGISDSCSCQCSFPLSTFYSKTRTCMNSQDLIYDSEYKTFTSTERLAAQRSRTEETETLTAAGKALT
jgi:hypothetical protein